MNTPEFEIAIIDPNTLMCLGLKNLLSEVIPSATIRVFSSFEAFIDDTPDMYSYYFISSQTYILYTAFFLPRKEKAVIMLYGTGNTSFHSANHLLNIFQPTEQLTRDLSKLFLHEKPHAHFPIEDHELSAREIEVLQLVTKGFINKEIAERLNISLTTVISHRKNITDKLGIKSVSGLTIYAVMNGYVDADRI